MSSFNLEITEKIHVGLKVDVFKSLARKVLKHIYPASLKGKGAGLSLVLVNNVEIRKLNKKYRKNDSSTDVLSFSFIEDEAAKLSPSSQQLQLGELYISVPTARRQAKEQGHSLQDEIEVLFLHGLLHILGYDHEKSNEREEMEALEQKFLGKKRGLICRVNK